MALLSIGLGRWAEFFLLVVWLAACAFWDIRTQTVPGWLTVVPLLGAAAARVVQGMWSAGALVAGLIFISDLRRRVRIPAAIGLALVLLLLSPTAQIGILVALLGIWLTWELSFAGGADAKVMIAVVLVLGDASVLLRIATAGAVVAIVAVIRKRRIVPYVVAIALGTISYPILFLLPPEGVIMNRFLSDRLALESTEVALLIAAVVLVAYAAYQVLGQKIAQVVMEIAGKF